ncbi:MAG TPA: O-antigen polymerase [Burkholderiaceae bacterium]|nr:O-antigen polymerase [Burkholderiaceae bacterium]
MHIPPRARAWTLSRAWWMHPTLTVMLLVVPVYLSFMSFDFDQVGVPSFIPSTNYWWGLMLLVTLATGALMGSCVRLAPMPARTGPLTFPAWLMALLLFLTVFAYVVWFYPIALEPDLLMQIVQGERANLRGLIVTRPGLTTLTQCGVAYTVACAIKPWLSGKPLARWERYGLVLVFALTIFRVFVWSERLAILEIVCAYFIAGAALRPIRSYGRRRLLKLLPLIAPVIVYLLFTFTESFRSWEFYRDSYSSIWAFSFDRLLTYYATASNNGIGLLEHTHDWPGYTGRFVFEWAYLLPLAGRLLRSVFGDARIAYQDFLEQFAREEFNNPSGLFPIVYDVGYFGSALYFLAIGFVIGLLYRRFVAGRMSGLLGYPSCFLFMIELLRFNYFTASRFIPVIFSLLLVALYVHRARPPIAGGFRVVPAAS